MKLDDELEDFEKDRVRDLRNHPGWEAVLKVIQRRRDSLAKDILSGQLSDDEYRLYSGEHKGVNYVVTRLEALLDRRTPGGPD